MKKRKVLYITGSRADFGRMRYILKRIQNDKKFRLYIFATASHLSSHFGHTSKEIEKEFIINGKSKIIFEKDDTSIGMLDNFAQEIKDFAKFINKIKPDIVMVFGDRGEMLAGAICAAHMNIPAVHIGGGHITGSIDDKIRNAITIFLGIHFVATKKHAERVMKLGAQKSKIHIVGAPDLEAIKNKYFTPKAGIYKKFKLNPSSNIVLLSQHPVADEYEQCAWQMTETLKALKNIPCQIVATYPNEDAGGKKMTKILKNYASSHPDISLYKHINYKDYLGLMNVANIMLGNSSAGIIESASFNLPAVNIGTRQKGRERAENVIDAGHSELEIRAGIKKGLFDKKFLKRVEKSKNPYGDGKTSEKIVSILKKLL